MHPDDEAPKPLEDQPEKREQERAALRQRAEQRLGAQDMRRGREEAAALAHELRVHQIELELQNEELRRAQTELEASRARYFDLYDLAPVGYLTLSESGLIEEANLAAATLLDRPRAQLVGQPLSNFICSEDQDLHYRCRRDLQSTGEPQRCELRLRHADEPPWVLMETCLNPRAGAGRAHWQCILIDITARKHGELELLDAQARLRLVTEIAELSFWEWDPRSDRLSVSSDGTASAAGWGQPAPARIGIWTERVHPEDRPRIMATIRGFVDAPRGPSEIQYRMRAGDSEYRWLQTRLEAILDPSGRLERVLLVHQDVTRRKETEDRAVQMAQHDPLTGLPARVLLDQLGEHMIAGARRSGGQLAVFFLDLDRFKAINDLHGHKVGDQVLQAVADRLRASLRAEDLISRLGGDEFVAVLASIHDAEEAAAAARKIIAALAPPHDISGLQLHCLASLGISLFPRDGDTLGQLMQRADLAMYQAKTLSPGHYQFVTEALNRRIRAAAMMEQRLRQAFARRELRLAYQPLIDVASGRVEGVEALLRWPQPDGGSIPPATFLPVAESLHLSHAIGQWTLQEACLQQCAWREAGLSRMPITVNVSIHQFYHPQFVPAFARICQEARADPGLLTLQISEATLLENRETAKRLLGALKTLGVKLVMDDFGLGCSSLCDLEDLPLDGLAIDRVLVQRLYLARSMPAIVDTIIHLGHALQLEMTAVGIESEADLRFFREHRCDQAQGFYLGTPMSGSAFLDWYRQQAPSQGSA
ncbi:sensor domain-containing protein [Thiocystis violacea]|uniref:sensor domain-containing protein n=1 Tax=Thiocystis violacea TaxID=13725 RepID=UPI001903D82A|nr:GGDEF and EAL domain-containing protein [Thiocystis violacea]MBK1721828.1 GGDEF domain-containing protein [Thiocystis violacea]